MDQPTAPSHPLQHRIQALGDKDIEKILSVFREKLDAAAAAYLNACVHCGLCADSCHYYLATGDHKAMPAAKLDLVNQVFKYYFSLTGKKFPRLAGAGALTRTMIEEWVDSLFGRCTLCGRCSLSCTMGINIFALIRAARSALAAVGLVPPGLQSTVDTAIRTGNNMGITKENWLETVAWLEEELRNELGDPRARLPVDRKGAKILYTINPREAMFFPLSISAAAKIFYAAGEDWTFSSVNFDVTNYGLYNGDDEAAGIMSGRLLQAAHELGCRELILAECGHGFNSNRWEAPEWLSREAGIPVRSVLQLVAGYVREGRIRLDPSKNPKAVTLHDPCNLVRLGGVVEEQREILRRSVLNFVEMQPNREKNYCCGGGAGQLAMTNFAKRRLEAGKIKADQIRTTGALIVATPCHNCIDQLMELKQHYRLPIEIKTVCEIAADALVIETEDTSTEILNH
ncbi:MAG: (Fe-S)-binding protein [Candidatus Aminicenantes bacterium]|nr:(Fe-S)-binding protein [Candidatus Aminicenantes bacterium]